MVMVMFHGCCIVIDCKWDEGVGESMPYAHIDKPGGDTFPRLHQKNVMIMMMMIPVWHACAKEVIDVGCRLHIPWVRLVYWPNRCRTCLPDDSHVINRDVITSCYCKRKRRCENSGLWWWCHLLHSVIAGSPIQLQNKGGYRRITGVPLLGVLRVGRGYGV